MSHPPWGRAPAPAAARPGEAPRSRMRPPIRGTVAWRLMLLGRMASVTFEQPELSSPQSSLEVRDERRTHLGRVDAHVVLCR
jgi:hypothetical protein